MFYSAGLFLTQLTPGSCFLQHHEVLKISPCGCCFGAFSGVWCHLLKQSDDLTLSGFKSTLYVLSIGSHCRDSMPESQILCVDRTVV